VAFQYESLHSGTPMFNQYVISVLNFVAMAPILFVGCFDRDCENTYISRHPDLYTSGRDNEHMSLRMMLRWFAITIIHIFIIYCLCVTALADKGMVTNAFDGLMDNKDDDFPGDGEIDFVTFGTIVFVVLIVYLGYKVLYETRAIIHGEIFSLSKCCTSSSSTTNTNTSHHTNTTSTTTTITNSFSSSSSSSKIISWVDYIPWTWVGTIIFSYAFWTLFVYIYSVIARDYFDEEQFNDVAEHVYETSSLAWYIFWLVPIAACIVDVSGKLFSNFYFPSQSQIHLEMEVLNKA